MSASEIQGITEALREMAERLARVEEKLKALCSDHDRIQCVKMDKRIKWENVMPSILSSLSVALVLYLIAKLA